MSNLQQTSEIHKSQSQPPLPQPHSSTVTDPAADSAVEDSGSEKGDDEVTMSTLTTLSQSAQTISQVLDDAGSQTSIGVHLDWDPVSRLRGDYSVNDDPELDKNGNPKPQSQMKVRQFSRVVVYTGTPEQTYVCTAGHYVSQHWPETVGVFDALQTAYGSTSYTSSTQVAGGKIVIDMHPGKRSNLAAAGTYVTLTGDKAFKQQMIEALSFLATACRASEDPLRPSLAGTMVSTTSSDRTVQLLVSVNHSTFPIDVPGLCWTKMVKNPAIAHDYPVPPRHDIGQQKGLELSFDLLRGLSDVQNLITLDDTIILSSLHSSLTLVKSYGTTLVWHLEVDATGAILAPEQALNATIEPGTTSSTTLSESRHLIGYWTFPAKVAAGGAGHVEALESSAQLSQRVKAGLSNLLVGCSLLPGFTFTFLFSLAKSDRSITSEAKPNVDLAIIEAKGKTVLFYGTHDKRGWLIDWLSAMLHMARQALHNPAARKSLSVAGKKLLDELDSYDGMDALQEIEKSRSVILWNQQGDPKQPLKFENFLMAAHRALQVARIGCSKAMDSSTFPDIRANGSPLGGYEYIEAAKSEGDLFLRYYEAELLPGMDKYLQLLSDLGAPVIFADEYGDLINPTLLQEDSPCRRYRPMKKGYGLVAIPHYVLLQLAIERPQRATGTLKIGTNSYICMQSKYYHHECICSSSAKCNIYSDIKDTPNDDLVGDSTLQQILTRIPEGATIVGGPQQDTPPLAAQARASRFQSHIAEEEEPLMAGGLPDLPGSFPGSSQQGQSESEAQAFEQTQVAAEEGHSGGAETENPRQRYPGKGKARKVEVEEEPPVVAGPSGTQGDKDK